MNTIRYKGYEGSIEVDVERQVCRGKILFIDDLVTYEAKSIDQIQTEFQLAVDDYLETCKALGRNPQKTFKGSFNVRMSPELHRKAAILAFHENLSLNELVGKAVAAYVG